MVTGVQFLDYVASMFYTLCFMLDFRHVTEFEIKNHDCRKLGVGRLSAVFV